jgi:hypothetical protein
VIERQLAHQERNNVPASYNHALIHGRTQGNDAAWADMIDDTLKETSNNQISFVRALTFQPA